MRTAIVIPARLKSTRFPNKMLIDMDGKPLIRRVYDICSTFGYDTYVLTDSQEIADVITKHFVIWTSPDCTNGTDRIMSAIGEELHYDKYINVQGDTPDPEIQAVKAVEKALDNHYVVQAHTKMDPKHLNDPSYCKMVHTGNHVHWYVRAAVEYGSHSLGYYGYTPEAKKRWDTFVQHGAELAESHEGLRWIENGDRLETVYVEVSNGMEINTPQEYELWKKNNESIKKS